jgi:NAD+ synthase (glutamine-hydrolysing)
MSLRVLIAQLNLLVGDIAGNAQRVIDSARQGRDELDADLVVFPELTLTGYPPEDLLLRNELDRRVAEALERVAAECRGIDVVLGYPVRRGGQRFNAAGVLRDGRVECEYHKALLPNYSVFDEKRYFEPGERACVFELKGVRIGLTVCEDIWFPAPARDSVAAGAQLILNLNASPYHQGKAREREQLVAARAREVEVPVVYANMVGGQDELVFDGGSFVVDAAGDLCLRAPCFSEAQALVAFQTEPRCRPVDGTVDPLPEELSAVYSALVSGVRDYVGKNGFRGAVLGLSGGIDSALTLAVAVDALGAEAVEVVLMPSRYTADMSNEDAVKQADTLGVKRHIIPIEPAFRAFLGMLSEAFDGRAVDVTEENIQARCRGIVLMALSNKTGRMLLTTGNKSEMAVGYATLYGDMAGGFAPLKDVPKILVYKLATWRNRDREVIPRRVIERPPSAELRPDQQDTDSLPAYEVLDALLERYVERDQSVAEIIAAGFDPETVRRITRMVDRNEYKRRQAPPGVRISPRAFGRDRRYPITSGF